METAIDISKWSEEDKALFKKMPFYLEPMFPHIGEDKETGELIVTTVKPSYKKWRNSLIKQPKQ